MTAIETIEKIEKEELPKMAALTSKEILEQIEIKNALLVAEMIIKAALLRQESRGAHFRQDFPYPTEQWQGNIFLKKSGDGMNLDFHSIELEHYE